MEPTKNHFSLNAELAKWQQTMSNGSLTTDDLAELTDHLTEEISSLQKAGLNDEEAWLVARQRIGQPIVIEAEFKKVNPDHSANRNLVMMLWGAVIFMMLQTVCFGIPSIVNFIYRPAQPDGSIGKLLTAQQLNYMIIFWIIAIIILSTFILTHGNKIIGWFTSALAKRYTLLNLLLLGLGSWFALFNFFAWNDGFNTGLTKDNSDYIYTNWQLLGVVFYTAIIALTVFSTLRYRKQEIVNLRSFGTHLNWKTTLQLAIMFELIALMSQSISFYCYYIVAAILFSFGGWVAGRSKQRWLNTLLFLTPCLVVLIVFSMEHRPNYNVFLLHITMVFCASLVGSMIGSKGNTAHLSTSIN